VKVPERNPNSETKEPGQVEGAIDIEPGTRYRLRASPRNAETKPGGAAYLFEFPFPVFVNDFYRSGITFQRSGSEVRIVAPFAREKSEWLESKSLSPGSVPLEHDPTSGWVLRGLKTAVENLGIAAHCLRVEVMPDLKDDQIEDLTFEFLRQVRTLTGQWWIGHDATPFGSYLKNRFLLSQEWRRISGVQIYSGAYGLWGFERTLKEDDLDVLVRRMNRRQEIPVSRELLFDGIFAHSSEDRRQAIIELSTACEAKIAEEFSRFGRENGLEHSARKAIDGKFMHRLDHAAFDLTGHSFKSNSPSEFEWLRCLWSARGNMAHGRDTPIRLPDGSLRTLDYPDLKEVIKAVIRLFEWAKSL
jgi:hypothetical protein